MLTLFDIGYKDNFGVPDLNLIVNFGGKRPANNFTFASKVLENNFVSADECNILFCYNTYLQK
jgi:hypothetical protein